MKILLYAIATLAVFADTPGFGQQAPPPSPNDQQFTDRLRNVISRASGEPEPALTKFSLDFPGGTPRQLVGAIEKAMGKPINVIVPDAAASEKLPAFKVNNVDVRQVFDAIERSGQQGGIQYAFLTSGKKDDDAVWTFVSVRRYAQPQKICRFYYLGPYIDAGMTVDDITTAIQTGWKMLGETDTPAINYHKDTKLLIAVGQEEKLSTIDSALRALEPSRRRAGTTAVQPENKPAAKGVGEPKTEN